MNGRVSKINQKSPASSTSTRRPTRLAGGDTALKQLRASSRLDAAARAARSRPAQSGPQRERLAREQTARRGPVAFPPSYTRSSARYRGSEACRSVRIAIATRSFSIRTPIPLTDADYANLLRGARPSDSRASVTSRCCACWRTAGCARPSSRSVGPGSAAPTVERPPLPALRARQGRPQARSPRPRGRPAGARGVDGGLVRSLAASAWTSMPCRGASAATAIRTLSPSRPSRCTAGARPRPRRSVPERLAHPHDCAPIGRRTCWRPACAVHEGIGAARASRPAHDRPLRRPAPERFDESPRCSTAGTTPPGGQVPSPIQATRGGQLRERNREMSNHRRRDDLLLRAREAVATDELKTRAGLGEASTPRPRISTRWE